MDDVQQILQRIADRVYGSNMSDTAKADCMAAVTVGMRTLVWPILISHVPEYMMREAADAKTFTIDAYAEIIDAALSNPATPKEIHDELTAALTEVDGVVTKALK